MEIKGGLRGAPFHLPSSPYPHSLSSNPVIVDKKSSLALRAKASSHCLTASLLPFLASRLRATSALKSFFSHAGVFSQDDAGYFACAKKAAASCSSGRCVSARAASAVSFS